MTQLPILLAWLLTDVTATYGVLHHRRAFLPAEPFPSGPQTAVLIPIKGGGCSVPRFLDALRIQRYDNFRLVFALESASDEAFPLVSGFQREMQGRRQVDVIVAGVSSQRAQKVHNLLAALGALRAEDRIVVFADADIVPGETWLSHLIRPVACGDTAASCGYRWQLAADLDWPSMMVAAADMSIATAARSRIWNLCWGGSVALDRAVLDRLDLVTVWNRAASDDLTLTRALRERNLRIYAPPWVLVPSPVTHRWSSQFQFMRRQYLLTRIYAPRHWLFAGWTLCLPGLGAAIAIGLLWQRQWWALWFLIASATLLQVRLLCRHSIARLVLPPAELGIATTTLRFAAWCWPLIHLMHIAGFLSSAIGRRFSWAGRRYRLVGRDTLA
jgi:cellulose synthase/poly-beta-1,6-N-acetylglucosamine synthase-like glycosyltransferase